MEIIYCCYGGSHTSVTAAALHLGLLARDRRPKVREIVSLPHFDGMPAASVGRIFRYGQDYQNNNIYIASLGPARRTTLSALRLFMAAAGIKDKDLLIIDALQCVNFPIRVGGFLSRRCGWVFVGRHLCAYGIVLNYTCFGRLVDSVEAMGVKGLTHRLR